MEEKIKKMLKDNVENPWEFSVKAALRYKKEFLKTSKIGSPPSIDNVVGRYILEQVEGVKEPVSDDAGCESEESPASVAVKDA